MASLRANDEHIRVRLASNAAELQRLAADPDLRDRAYLVAEIPSEELRNVRDELACRGDAAALAGLLQSVRGSDPVPASGSAKPVFTPLEERIGRFVMRGMTNRQIAGQLHLAENTVRNYVSGMIQKRGVQNRTELAVHLAQSQGR